MLENISCHCRVHAVACVYCSIEAALSVFSQMRPPGIYKQDYLGELSTRYGDRDDIPLAPPLPDWCLGQCQFVLYILLNKYILPLC